MDIKTKKIIAREILFCVGVIIYMIAIYIILQNTFNGAYKINFNVFASQTDEYDFAVNTWILFAPFIILYLIRPIILLVRWCFKTLFTK